MRVFGPGFMRPNTLKVRQFWTLPCFQSRFVPLLEGVFCMGWSYSLRVCCGGLGKETIKFWQDRWLNGRPRLEQDGVLQVGDVAWPTANGMLSVKTPYTLLFHGSKILSNEQRARRHLVDDPACNYYNWPVESILHIFRDCEKATNVWHAMLGPVAHPHFLHMEFHPWPRSNLLSKAMWGDHVPWTPVFVFTCWVLWKWRTNHIFNIDDEVRYEPKKIIVAAVKEWYTSSQVGDTKASKIPLLLAWEPLELGQFKLNVDGSRRCASGSIGAGGVICNSLGDWICGFAVNLGIRRLTVEMDAAMAVLLVQQHSRLGSHPLASLIASCCAMVRQFGVCVLSHIYRERNDVADCLAKWSHDLDLGLCVLDAAPSWIGALLVDDLLGVPRTRWVSLASG
ncbi:unnamed protein product [Prunus armeniaca]